MRQLRSLLVLSGLAAAAAAQGATTHPVTVTLGYDGGDKKCFVATVDPMTVDADPGDSVQWTATDGSGQCGNKKIKLARFKLKDEGTPKDPAPKCTKETTAGGAAITCTLTDAAKGDHFKYDVELPGGKGLDPEIRIRN